MATALLGAWIGITVCMWFAATGSFSTVDRVLKDSHPRFSEVTKPIGPDRSRAVLRYLASEINRTYFRAYSWAQVALAALLLLLLVRQTPRDPVALATIGAMFAVVLVLTFYVTPEIVSIGRALDFVPREPAPPEMGRFRIFHGAYTGLDGAKLLAGIVLLARWMMAR
jgi:hypothetical protein